MRTTIFALTLAALCNFGCANTAPSTAGGNTSATCDRSENLLRNPAFVVDASGAARPWSSAQHAGEKSFELRLDAGEAWIEKIGTQPWFTYTQMVPVRPLRGEEMLFTAELALGFDGDEVDHGFDVGGGLALTLWGDPDPVMGGDRLLRSSLFEHEPHLGRSDWTPVQLRFRVPEDATRMRLGFAHYASGWMAVRKPALFRCSPAT